MVRPSKEDDEELYRQKYFFAIGESLRGRLSIGFGWLLDMSRRHTPLCNEEAFIAVDSVTQWQDVLNVTDHVYLNYFRRLNVPLASVEIPRSCKIRIVTNLPIDGEGREILVVHPSQDFLRDLDQTENICAMIVLAWNRNEIEDWIKKRDPLDVDETAWRNRNR